MRYRSTADVRLFSFSSIVQPFQNVLNICVPEIPVMYPLSLFTGDTDELPSDIFAEISETAVFYENIHIKGVFARGHYYRKTALLRPKAYLCIAEPAVIVICEAVKEIKCRVGTSFG